MILWIGFCCQKSTLPRWSIDLLLTFLVRDLFRRTSKFRGYFFSILEVITFYYIITVSLFLVRP